MKDIKYYDTHAHLNIEPLDVEIEPIIDELKKEKTIMNCIAVDLETSISSIELSKKYKGIVFGCVGIHPTDGWMYRNNVDQTIKELEKIIVENREHIICLGEIGLDYYTIFRGSEIDKPFQQEMFRKQLELAVKYDLPINIHNRESENDLLDILKDYQLKKVMIHCFSANKELALKYLERGYYLSIPGIVTFKNAKDLQEAVKIIPLEKMVVETDCPFLTPVPYRGQTNKPQYVKYVAKEIAKLKGLDEEFVEKQLLENAINFFEIKDRINN